MRYFVLKSVHAVETLEALRTGQAVDMERMVEIRGEGDDFDLEAIHRLGEELYRIKSNYPERLRRRDPRGGDFEIEACVPVHKAIPFDPEMLADYGFWTWLAVTQFRELVDWRHGGESGRSAPANFGIGNGSENLFYRMWLRADIAFDASRSDPYELARRGDQDFWRSHVLRQRYGQCRTLTRALIRYQFPDDSPGSPTLKIPEIRELAKRLRRLDTNLVFEYLDEPSASTLVQCEAERAKSTVVAHIDNR